MTNTYDLLLAYHLTAPEQLCPNMIGYPITLQYGAKSITDVLCAWTIDYTNNGDGSRTANVVCEHGDRPYEWPTYSPPPVVIWLPVELAQQLVDAGQLAAD